MLAKPPVEVADAIRRFGGAGVRANRAQRRVLRDLGACRTAQLGGHVEVCPQCDATKISYNSCRNRHCPKCMVAKAEQWTDARLADLLPTHYFHVVFTVPQEVAHIALQNKAKVYGLLFQSAHAAICELTQDPKHLGAQTGMLAVLHTWTQTLLHHPHLHCVIPGGGLTQEGTWKRCPKKRFLPVKVLSQVFRRHFMDGLEKLYQEGLSLKGRLEPFAHGHIFDQLVVDLKTKPWVVYAKRPFGGPEQVLKYLARYTHRVAISNRRMVAVTETSVTFRYRKPDQSHACMTLAGPEFLRRFLMHVLPKGFVRIRYYGLLGSRCRAQKLALCREAMGVALEAVTLDRGVDGDDAAAADRDATADSSPSCRRCPDCEVPLVRVEEFAPQDSLIYVRRLDSS